MLRIRNVCRRDRLGAFLFQTGFLVDLLQNRYLKGFVRLDRQVQHLIDRPLAQFVGAGRDQVPLLQHPPCTDQICRPDLKLLRYLPRRPPRTTLLVARRHKEKIKQQFLASHVVHEVLDPDVDPRELSGDLPYLVRPWRCRAIHVVPSPDFLYTVAAPVSFSSAARMFASSCSISKRLLRASINCAF